MASFDGFYLTRGHYSNNSSATLHDYLTGEIAWFTHRTKRGSGHNWEGTSNGAEGDMFDEILGRVKEERFVIKEIMMPLVAPHSVATFQRVQSLTAQIILPKTCIKI